MRVALQLTKNGREFRSFNFSAVYKQLIQYGRSHRKFSTILCNFFVCMLLSLFVSSEPLRLSHSLSTRCRHWFFFSFSFHFVCAEMPWMPRMPNAEYRAWRCTDASAGYRHFTFCAFFSHFLFRLLCAWACVWVCGEYYFSTSLKSRSFSSVHHGYTEHFVVNSIGLFSFLLLFSPIVFQFHIILYNFIYIHTRTWLIIYMNCSSEEKKTDRRKEKTEASKKKAEKRVSTMKAI